jgi:GTP-binding protein EngB required for normal cell division
MGFLFSCKPKDQFFFDLEDEKMEKINELSLKIYVFGNLPQRQQFIEIFNKKISDSRYSHLGDCEFKTDQFYWILKIVPDLSKNTIESQLNEIEEDFNKRRIEQNVIVFFDDSNIDILFNEMQKLGNLFNPLIIIISKKEVKIKSKYDPRKITNIILNEKTQEQLNNIIISQLWEYDCYYNEKGNKLCKYTPDNIFKNLYNNVPYYSLNILLTGKSRAGKSTFINYITNRLTALESCKKTSVSTKKTEYCFYANNSNYENVPIKFFDTPGMVPGKLEECKNFLSNLLNNQDNNLEEQIHFILFFFMENESLEGVNEIFEILNNCRKPVLFIINKSTDDSDNGKSKDIKSTISYLEQNNFMNLTDSNNFISVNIVKTKSFSDYGVNDVFQRIYDIFIEKNDFLNEKKKI